MKRIKYILPALFLLTGITALGQSANPYQELGKNQKVLTLTKGQYAEFFDEDSLQQVGTVLMNVHTGKVVKLLSEEEAQARLQNDKQSRFLSVDPLTSSYPELTPYQYASNRPIDGIDLDGKEFFGFGYLVDKLSDGASKIGLQRTAGFIESYGHSLFFDPVYSAHGVVKTVQQKDVSGTAKQFDPTGISAIPDVVNTAKSAAEGDEKAQGQLLGMVPGLIGGHKIAKANGIKLSTELPAGTQTAGFSLGKKLGKLEAFTAEEAGSFIVTEEGAQSTSKVSSIEKSIQIGDPYTWRDPIYGIEYNGQKYLLDGHHRMKAFSNVGGNGVVGVIMLTVEAAEAQFKEAMGNIKKGEFKTTIKDNN